MPWTTVYADSDTVDTFIPCTPWMSTSGITQLRAPFEIAASDANIKLVPAFQTANVYSEPDSGNKQLSMTQESGDGFYFPAKWYDPKTDFEDKQIVRFGFACKLENSGNPALARATGTIQVVSE